MTSVSSSIFVLLILSLQCTSRSVSAAENGIEDAEGRSSDLPGMSVRITQKGLDYGIKIALNSLMENMHNPYFGYFEFFDHVMRVKITNLPRPDIRIKLMENHPRTPTNEMDTSEETTHSRSRRSAGSTWHNEDINPGNTNEGYGGIRIEARNLSIDMTGYVNTNDSSISSQTEETLNLSISATNIYINLTAYVGEKDGKFALASLQCQASGDLDLSTIRPDGISFSTIFGFDPSLVEEFLFKKNYICDRILAKIGELREIIHSSNMNSVIYQFPALIFDYRLTEAPLFTNEYVEVRHRATFQPRTNLQVWPFGPQRMNPPEEAERMVYLMVTDYTLNTLWHSLLEENYLKHTFKPSDMERLAAQYFDTSGVTDIECSTELCRSFLYPNMSRLPPMEVEISMNPFPIEVFKFHGRRVIHTAHATFSYFLIEANTKTKLLTLNNSMSCEFEIDLDPNRIVFNFTNSNISSEIVEYNLPVAQADFRTVLNTMLGPVFKSTLEKISRQEMHLPPLPSLKLPNLTILDTIDPGFLILGTDFEVDLQYL